MPIYKGTKTKDGRSYYFRKKYKDFFGMQKDYTSCKYLTKQEAVEAEANFIIKIKESSSTNITLKEAYYKYRGDLGLKVKKQTLIKTDNLFKYYKAIQDVKINKLDLSLYRKFKTYLDGVDLSAHYKNKILGLLRRVITYSNRFYNTSTLLLNYIDNYKDNSIKKEMDFFTHQEYLQFRSVITEIEYQTFFDCLYYLGLRQGELQALTWQDIDLQNKIVKITKTLTTKIKGENWTISTPKTKNSIRTLPLPKNVLNGLKTMYNKALKVKFFRNDFFVFGMIQPFKESTIQKYKNKYCDLSGLRRIRIHDFRHSCASFLINQGASISLVSKYLGHSNITITLNTYTHLYKNELEDITNKINNLV